MPGGTAGAQGPLPPAQPQPSTPPSNGVPLTANQRLLTWKQQP